MPVAPADTTPLRVVLFSGGRGSGALTTTLVRTPGVALIVAINGYDDGASTGEVRRFLGDALGPSDFRKNASRLAAELGTCTPALIRLVDRRLPAASNRGTLDALIRDLSAAQPADADLADLPAALRGAVAERLSRFATELDSGRPFDFHDCSVGNLVFAGGFLRQQRAFNSAVDDYAQLLGLPVGLVENVTDGTNAHLAAIDIDGRVLGREADIVDANRQNRIHDIYLLPAPPDAATTAELERQPLAAASRALEGRQARPSLNPRLAAGIAAADLIVYAPGTQHSSLFPSYLTAGLSDALSANTRAVKLLITNIQTDAEIAGSSAVDIIERAVFYLKEKGTLATPTPALVTHYLVNDPGGAATPDKYVPLGRVDALHDSRLVRIGRYEHSGSGRHDAAKVLRPYVENLLARRRERRRLAVLLYEGNSPDTVAETLLEMVRGGLADQGFETTVFCETAQTLDRAFLARLPFAVREVGQLHVAAEDERLRRVLVDEGFEYVVLFESSGMYNGEDIPWLAAHLTGRLDAVWGSRRLSVRDIEESYRLIYRKNAVLGAISRSGSHVLSLGYLLMYGRYVSDTLSGARAVKVSDLRALPVPLTHKHANQYLLSDLLRRKAEMFELPVHFYPQSPHKVRRTTMIEGLQAVAAIVWRRLIGPERPPGADIALSPESADTVQPAP